MPPPFACGLAGMLMPAGVLTRLSEPVAAIIGTVSVFKAVYVPQRDRKGACASGSSMSCSASCRLSNLGSIAVANWMLVGMDGMWSRLLSIVEPGLR